MKNFKRNIYRLISTYCGFSGTAVLLPELPRFNQLPLQFSGNPGETYTYIGFVSDPDHPADILPITVVSGLPVGWSFTQTPGTNMFTLTGTVPAGADYTIVLQVADLDVIPNTAIQNVVVNSVFATLSNMEFKLEYINATVPAGGFGQSPKTTSPIVLSSQPPGFQSGHTCNRAQFNLVAGVFANTNNGEWRWTNLGKGSLNNVSYSTTYNVFDSVIPILASNPYILDGTTNILGAPYCITPPCSYIDGSAMQTNLGNVPNTNFANGNPNTYYNSTTAAAIISAGTDRGSYFDISTAQATSLSTASNWGGALNTNRGVIKFKLVPNSYVLSGVADYHGNSSWLQIFKRNAGDGGNPIIYNQEEVLVGGNSFLLNAAVVVTVNILNNTVSVGTT